MAEPALDEHFYARPVVPVARDLIGCLVEHDGCSGVIVETEAYHFSEPACHAYVGLTARTATLYGTPGTAYVYRSYGIHAMLNAVCEPEEIGAAVLIRALEPRGGLEAMRRRRGLQRATQLCSGPGKLTEALGISLALNGTSLAEGPIVVRARGRGWRRPRIVTGPRIGITRAVDLPWRFCALGTPHVSRPWPPELRPSLAA
jgi:DNA-3-methyladenine glycosylase